MIRVENAAEFTGTLCFQRREIGDDAPWRCKQPDCKRNIGPGEYFVVSLTIDAVGSVVAEKWCMHHGTHVNLGPRFA